MIQENREVHLSDYCTLREYLEEVNELVLEYGLDAIIDSDNAYGDIGKFIISWEREETDEECLKRMKINKKRARTLKINILKKKIINSNDVDKIMKLKEELQTLMRKP